MSEHLSNGNNSGKPAQTSSTTGSPFQFGKSLEKEDANLEADDGTAASAAAAGRSSTRSAFRFSSSRAEEVTGSQMNQAAGMPNSSATQSPDGKPSTPSPIFGAKPTASGVFGWPSGTATPSTTPSQHFGGADNPFTPTFPVAPSSFTIGSSATTSPTATSSFPAAFAFGQSSPAPGSGQPANPFEFGANTSRAADTAPTPAPVAPTSPPSSAFGIEPLDPSRGLSQPTGTFAFGPTSGSDTAAPPTPAAPVGRKVIRRAKGPSGNTDASAADSPAVPKSHADHQKQEGPDEAPHCPSSAGNLIPEADPVASAPAAADPLDQPADMSVKQCLAMQAEMARLRTTVEETARTAQEAKEETKLLQGNLETLTNIVKAKQTGSHSIQDDFFRWKKKMGLCFNGQISEFLLQCKETDVEGRRPEEVLISGGGLAGYVAKALHKSEVDNSLLIEYIGTAPNMKALSNRLGMPEAWDVITAGGLAKILDELLGQFSSEVAKRVDQRLSEQVGVHGVNDFNERESTEAICRRMVDEAVAKMQAGMPATTCTAVGFPLTGMSSVDRIIQAEASSGLQAESEAGNVGDGHSGALPHAAQPEEEIVTPVSDLQLQVCSIPATCSWLTGLHQMVLSDVNVCISTAAVSATDGVLSPMEWVWVNSTHMTRNVAPSWTTGLDCFSTGNYRFFSPLSAHLESMTQRVSRDECCFAGPGMHSETHPRHRQSSCLLLPAAAAPVPETATTVGSSADTAGMGAPATGNRPCTKAAAAAPEANTTTEPAAHAGSTAVAPAAEGAHDANPGTHLKNKMQNSQQHNITQKNQRAVTAAGAEDAAFKLTTPDASAALSAHDNVATPAETIAAGVYAAATEGVVGNTGNAANTNGLSSACSDGADSLEGITDATCAATRLVGAHVQSRQGHAVMGVWPRWPGVTVVAASAFVVYAAVKLAQRRRA